MKNLSVINGDKHFSESNPSIPKVEILKVETGGSHGPGVSASSPECKRKLEKESRLGSELPGGQT